MALICVNCALRAMLDNLPAPRFSESPEEHLRRVHSDPVLARAERIAMERELLRRLDDQSN